MMGLKRSHFIISGNIKMEIQWNQMSLKASFFHIFLAALIFVSKSFGNFAFHITPIRNCDFPDVMLGNASE